MVITCASAIAETTITSFFLAGFISLGELLAWHGAVVLILCILFRVTWAPAGAPRHVATLLLSTAALGPIGAFGTLLQMFAYTLFRRSSKPFMEWYSLVVPSQEQSLSVRTYHAIIAGAIDSGSQRSLTSFVDVLSLGTHQQQRTLLALIAEHFRPSFAPALKLALQHRDPAVRVLAATAANRIEAQRSGRLDALGRDVHVSPSKVDCLRRLAAQMIEDVESGLTSAERSDRLMRDASSFLLKSEELDPGDVETAISIARLMLRLGRSREVIGWLDKHPKIRDREPGAFAAYLEALFNLRQYSLIRSRLANRDFAPVIDAMATQPKLAAAAWQQRVCARVEMSK